MSNHFGLQMEHDHGRGLSNMVGSALRKAIIGKVLKPGDRLVEAKVAQELKVSITPVRQAFAQLAREGLITVFPYKGTYVTEITDSFIQEVYSIRKMLELKAVELAFPHFTPRDFEVLEAQAYQMDRLSRSAENQYEVTELDIAFHQLFYERSGNSLLMEMSTLIQSRVKLLQSYGRIYPLPKDQVLSRHIKLVHALRENNVSTVLTYIEEHIDTSAEMIKNNIRRK